MKKIKLLLSVVLFAFAFSFVTANTADAAGNISIYINGEKQSFSSKAIVENGNTLVPLRGIFEELGATVYWNPETQTINAKKGNTDVWLKIGSKQTKVNSIVNYISAPAKVKNGSTLVPLRFISESLGAKVEWNQNLKAIKITQDEASDEQSVPREYSAALKKAESYAEIMYMSKAGIYDQLTSEYGENFPAEAAQYAIDNIVVNWKDNALKKARTYAEMMNMSNSAIYEQLISEYGEKFTPEEAQYAIDNLK